MAEFVDQVFGRGVVVELDGNVYRRCKFEGARLRYSGGPAPAFADCTLVGVTWAFGGAAANALRFLSDLYNHFGELGRRDAEEMIRNIKSGRHRSI